MSEWGLVTDHGRVRVYLHEGKVDLDLEESYSYAPGMASVTLAPEQARNLAVALLKASGAAADGWLVCTSETYYPSVDEYATEADARREYAATLEWSHPSTYSPVYLALVVEATPSEGRSL